MTDRLRIALAQLNPKVGALASNLALARAALADAVAAKADILMFSELFLTGYFPEDLLLKPQFIADAMRAARDLASSTAGCDVSLLIPTVWREGRTLYNAVLLAEHGEIVATRFKRELPNDDVFYEKRYFTPGPLAEPMTIKGVSIGVPICEDIWHEDVCAHLVDNGARILLCPNGSPYWRDKQHVRMSLALARVREDNVPLLYLNQVGGQDELVYDGGSFGVEPGDRVVFQGKSFESDFIVSDWQRTPDGWRCVSGEMTPAVSVDEAPWRACMLGLRDYVKKNGFTKVVLGLSGGIDSAVVAAMAVDALGAENVHCLMLPYRYTSQESLRDAKDCAERLGVRYDVVAIGGPVDQANEALAPTFAGLPPDLTEENLQSRMRGLLLMAVSNKFNSLLLTTGNKSEMTVGYATIYGDMNGGFNPLKDLLKMQVYGLADWRNTHVPGDCLGPSGEMIPQAIIDKAPSAELRPDQKDQDSLPPYPVLDAILEGLVEQELSVAEIVAGGFDLALVKRIERLLYIAEFKRRQAAPGVKLSSKAFGLGRKYPITNGYRDESGSDAAAVSPPKLRSQGVE
ncbi:MAG: synthetase [Hyphomicrobiales bacterium]|nr:synthetase [Hyphomicrobiales bacterium]